MGNKINQKNFYSYLKYFLIIIFFASIFWPYTIYSQCENYYISAEICPIDSYFSADIVKNFVFIFKRTFTFYIQIILTLIYIFEFIIFKKTLSLSFISKFILFILGYSLLINIIYFKSFEYLTGINYYFHYIFNISTALLIASELDKNKKIIQTIINLFAILSTFLSIQLVFGIFTSTNLSSQRITLFGWKENILSFVFIIGYTIICSLIVDNKNHRKFSSLILISSTIIIIDAIILTGTRAFIFCILIIQLQILYSFFHKPINKNLKIILFISNIGFYISKTTSYKPVTDRFFVDNFTTIGGRMAQWVNTLKLANENPGFGVGVENYLKDYLNIHIEERFGMPENLFLELYVTAGFFALCMISLLVLYLYVNAFFVFIKTKRVESLIWLTPLLTSTLVFNIRHLKVFFAFLCLYLIRESMYSQKLNINPKKLFLISRNNFK